MKVPHRLKYIFLDLEAAALKAELLAASNDASLKMKTQKERAKRNGEVCLGSCWQGLSEHMQFTGC